MLRILRVRFRVKFTDDTTLPLPGIFSGSLTTERHAAADLAGAGELRPALAVEGGGGWDADAQHQVAVVLSARTGVV